LQQDGGDRIVISDCNANSRQSHGDAKEGRMTDTLPPKAPPEVLDYFIDGTDLLAAGETIVEAGSTITVTGATKDSATFADTSVTVWISAGTAGTPIYLSATLRTSGGRTYQRLYVIPYGEPVTLEQAKAQCRVIDDTSQDELIAGYITAAREFVEEQTGHVLVQREFTEYREDLRCRFIELLRRPVLDDPAPVITYTDTSGDEQTYDEAVFSVARYPARIYPSLTGWWPAVSRNGTVSIAYTAGYADGEVPQRAIQAILMLVGHWFAKRETAEISTAQAMEVPFAVTSLCGQLRGLAL
jgi:uncharacterized phiE125 gp8 family phage protein